MRAASPSPGAALVSSLNPRASSHNPRTSSLRPRALFLPLAARRDRCGQLLAKRLHVCRRWRVKGLCVSHPALDLRVQETASQREVAPDGVGKGRGRVAQLLQHGAADALLANVLHTYGGREGKRAGKGRCGAAWKGG
jgi:hypothetical protein